MAEFARHERDQQQERFFGAVGGAWHLVAEIADAERDRATMSDAAAQGARQARDQGNETLAWVGLFVLGRPEHGFGLGDEDVGHRLR